MPSELWARQGKEVYEHEVWLRSRQPCGPDVCAGGRGVSASANTTQFLWIPLLLGLLRQNQLEAMKVLEAGHRFITN